MNEKKRRHSKQMSVKESINQKICFAGMEMKNPLMAASSPLTETPERVLCCKEAGFGGVILKTAAEYVRTGDGYGRKVVFMGEDYFADASFEREILTAEEGIVLYRKACADKGDMLVIPSVSASSAELSDWLSICRKFEECGAKLIQLDFFYLGTLIGGQGEQICGELKGLLSGLQEQLSCQIMPKLNFNLEPDKICAVLAESGIRQVSLLDSIRAALPERFGLHASTTSYFGGKQLPVTIEYLDSAVSAGLEVCAGGGITCAEDADVLFEHGAKTVQTASYVLKKGFSSAPLLLHREPAKWKEERNTWCDAAHFGGKGCEKCGFCCS